MDKVGIFGPTGGGKPNCFLGSKNELKIALNGLKVTKLPWDTPPPSFGLFPGRFGAYLSCGARFSTLANQADHEK